MRSIIIKNKLLFLAFVLLFYSPLNSLIDKSWIKPVQAREIEMLNLNQNLSRLTHHCLPSPELSIVEVPEGIRLEWIAVSGADRYKVYRTADPNDHQSWVLLTSTSELQYTDAVLMSQGFFYVTAEQDSQLVVVVTPEINLSTAGEITINCATLNTTTYYTRNGDDPNPDEVWHPTNYPDSWTFEYDPDGFLQTKIPITFKAVAVDGDGNTSAVASWLPEDMIKTCHYADVASAGFDTGVINEAALDAEIAYIKNNGLYDKICYFISKDFGHHIGTDQTDPDARPSIVGLSFDDCLDSAAYTMQMLRVNDNGDYKQRATLFAPMGLLGTSGFPSTADVSSWAADGMEIADHGYSLCRGYQGMEYNIEPSDDAWGMLSPQEQYNELYQQDQAYVAQGLPISDWFAPHGDDDGKPVQDEDWNPYMFQIAQFRRYNRPTGAQDTGRGIIGMHDMNMNNVSCAALSSVDQVKDNKCVAFMYRHHAQTDNDLAALLTYCSINNIPVRPYSEVVSALNSYCTKYVNLIKRNFQVIAWMDKYIPLTASQKGLIIFDCAYGNIGDDTTQTPATIVAHYRDQGYEVAFWTDESAQAVECLIPEAITFLQDEPVILDANEDWFEITDPDSEWKAGKLGDFGSSSKRQPVILSGTTPPIPQSGQPQLVFGQTYWAGSQYSEGRYYIKIFASQSAMGYEWMKFQDAGAGLSISTTRVISDLYSDTDIMSPQKMQKRGLDPLIVSNRYLQGAYIGGSEFGNAGFTFLNNLVKLIINGHICGELDERIRLLYSCDNISLTSGGLTSGLDVLCKTSCPYILKYLNLSNNILAEEIPSGIGKFSKLITLNLSNNLIYNSIPDELGHLVNLSSLDLHNNPLSHYEPGAISITQTTLNNIRLDGCALADQEDVDAVISDVLAMVQAGGSTGGTLSLHGGTNAVPSQTGLTNINTLQNTYGWQVAHN